MAESAGGAAALSRAAGGGCAPFGRRNGAKRGKIPVLHGKIAAIPMAFLFVAFGFRPIVGPTDKGRRCQNPAHGGC